jgi:hypothetical protein
MSNTFPSGLIGDVVSFNYRRRLSGTRESWHDLCVRTIDGIAKLGKFTDEEKALVFKLQKELKTLTSGRWLWVGGTEWIDKPENFAGAYNCQSSNIIDWAAFGYAMNFAMMGTGTGGVLEDKYISQLPVIRNRLNVRIIGEIGAVPIGSRQENTTTQLHPDDGNRNKVVTTIVVGDSRKGWVDAYFYLLSMSSKETTFPAPTLFEVTVDISNVRPNGEKLKGFGGTANPIKLAGLFPKLANITNKALGRKLTSVECCLIMDEAALVVVAGNVRRSAGMRQGGSNDEVFGVAKEDLWQCIDGAWKIDPERDALRMANHTRVFHQKPSQDEVLSSVRKQYHSGEGAIQWAGEAIARSNADLLDTEEKKQTFLEKYSKDGFYEARAHSPFANSKPTDDELNWRAARFGANPYNQRLYGARAYLHQLKPDIDTKELDHRMSRYGLNPCFAEGTMVLTRNGDFPIESLVGKTVDIFDGHKWRTIDNFRVTAENQPVYKLTLHSGMEVIATEYHKFILEDGSRVELKDLKKGDRLWGIFFKPIPESDYDYGFNQPSPNNYTVKSVEFSHVADKVYCCTVEGSHSFTLADGLVVGQCGEILGSNFFCNLSEIHLNRLDPHNHKEQDEAFRAAALTVCGLLHHDLSALGDRFAYSREIDPIIGVSFTGLFDFFVNLFGRDWLDWWAAGRPAKWGRSVFPDGELFAPNPKSKWYGQTVIAPIFLSSYFKSEEEKYLSRWRETVETTAREYCARHGLKLPNRCTTVQPSGSKALLTGASAGWHPSYAPYFIRRVTKAVNDPVALAAIALGYSVVPAQTDKDENGNLLTDPRDPRCTEWLIEIPYAMPWADVADGIDFNFSALAQFDFYMQVQQHYTRHNTSATISLRESEIEPLANAIYESIQNDTGYISAALLARFDENQTFPRLPFEAIDKATYERLSSDVKERATMTDFDEALALFDNGKEYSPEVKACEGVKCELGSAIDEAKQAGRGFEVELV